MDRKSNSPKFQSKIHDFFMRTKFRGLAEVCIKKFEEYVETFRNFMR